MIVIQGTNYAGEVLEALLTRAATGNELVEKGLIHVVPEVAKQFSIPRLRTGKMLQKRKEMPTDEDAKGDFTYDERTLVPVDFMARSVSPQRITARRHQGREKRRADCISRSAG